MYTGSVPQPRLIEFGATCTLALLHGSLLTIGNAGDSAAILGRCACRSMCASRRPADAAKRRTFPPGDSCPGQHKTGLSISCTMHASRMLDRCYVAEANECGAS